MLTTGNERTCAYACVSAAFISRPMAPAQDLPDVLDAFCLRTNEVRTESARFGALLSSSYLSAARHVLRTSYSLADSRSTGRVLQHDVVRPKITCLNSRGETWVCDPKSGEKSFWAPRDFWKRCDPKSKQHGQRREQISASVRRWDHLR